MEILNRKEVDDGSCMIDCVFSPEEQHVFIQEGLNTILRRRMEEEAFIRGESETITITFDPNSGWVGAVEALYKKLTDPARGENKYTMSRSQAIVNLIRFTEEEEIGGQG